MWPVYAKAIQGLIAQPLTAAQVRSLTEVMNALLEPHAAKAAMKTAIDYAISPDSKNAA